MKCEVCLALLEEYFDGELAERESTQVAAHLVSCVTCATESAALTAEQEMFSRYDRELEVSPLMWERIAEEAVAPVAIEEDSRIGLREWLVGFFKVPSFGFSVAALALILIAVLVGAVYVRSRQQQPHEENAGGGRPGKIEQLPKPVEPVVPESTVEKEQQVVAEKRRQKVKRSLPERSAVNQSDVVSADFGYQDPEDEDTAKHIEQTQNLLRSIRNVQVSDTDQEIDVSYDKALSRKLLNENIVLRRDAEMKAKFPTKSLLSDLEPFLIDIANLPDQAKPDDVRAIKERVQKTEIVAALIGYK